MIKNKLNLIVLLSLFGLSSSTLADHREERLKLNAHKLDDSATHLQSLLRRETGYSHIARDAYQLADKAKRFHREIEKNPYWKDSVCWGSWWNLQTAYENFLYQFRSLHRVQQGTHLVEDWLKAYADYERINLEMLNVCDSYRHYPDYPNEDEPRHH